jgi:hypothetical protein
VFLGLASDVQFATWLLDHLTGFVLMELADHLMGDIAIGAERRKVINGFVDGITWRIAERLRELCKPAAAAPASSNSRAHNQTDAHQGKNGRAGNQAAQRQFVRPSTR